MATIDNTQIECRHHRKEVVLFVEKKQVK